MNCNASPGTSIINFTEWRVATWSEPVWVICVTVNAVYKVRLWQSDRRRDTSWMQLSLSAGRGLLHVVPEKSLCNFKWRQKSLLCCSSTMEAALGELRRVYRLWLMLPVSYCFFPKECCDSLGKLRRLTELLSFGFKYFGYFFVWWHKLKKKKKKKKKKAAFICENGNELLKFTKLGCKHENTEQKDKSNHWPILWGEKRLFIITMA